MFHRKNKHFNILGGLLGWLWLSFVVVPIYYIIVTSLRGQGEIYSTNPLSLPHYPTADAYIRVFKNDFLSYVGNSIIVAVATVTLILLVTVMAAYAIVRRADR